MFEAKKLAAEILSQDCVVEYEPPRNLIEKRVVRSDGENYNLYIIKDDDDSDCGRIVLHLSTFDDIWFDWYDGALHAKDLDFSYLLEDAEVLNAIRKKIGEDALVGLETCRASGVSAMSFWRRIISRCLAHDDSLMGDLKVKYIFEMTKEDMDGEIVTDPHDDWLSAQLRV